MKIKIICLLTILFGCGLAASPNRNCDGVRCVGKPKQLPVAPAKKVVQIDDVELVPFNRHLYNF
jgi:hypothetical protein